MPSSVSKPSTEPTNSEKEVTEDQLRQILLTSYESEPKPKSEQESESSNTTETYSNTHDSHIVIESHLTTSAEPETSSKLDRSSEPQHVGESISNVSSNQSTSVKNITSNEPATSTTETVKTQEFTYDFSTTEKHENFADKPAISLVSSETTTDSSSKEKVAPVTEDISDDTPMPTETYFKAPRILDTRQDDINIMDGSTTPRNEQTSPVTFYTQPSLFKIEHESSSEMSPFLPIIESSPDRRNMYAVTENVAESDTVPSNQSLDQSPFLPEGVNNATLLNILNAGHDGSFADQNDTIENAVTKEDFKEKKKKPRLDDDENYEYNPVDNDYHEDKIDSVPTVAPEVLSVVPLAKTRTTSEPTDDHDDLDFDHTEIMDISTEDQILSETTWHSELTSTNKSRNVELVDMTTVSDIESENDTEIMDNSTEYQINEEKVIRDKENATQAVKLQGDEQFVGSTEMPNESTESSTDTDRDDVSTKKIQNESTPVSDAINDIYESSEKYTKSGDLYDDGYSRINDNDLKVIPLATQNRKSERIIDVNHSTVKPNELDDTNQESSTGHFLDKATFQSINESIETSRSSDSDNSHNNLDDKNEMIDAKQDTKLEGTIAFSRCTAGQFECTNGTSIKDGSPCIALSERCDSIAQCTDNSDEAECERLGCPGHFQCNDGTCLARHLVCDGNIKHCNDGSDELNCDNWKCHFDEISCSANGTGPCLPSLWQCDGLEHCSNGADETNCPGDCKNNEFFCSVQRRCIPETWKCDGEVDCMEGEDERLCDCPLDSFRCETGGGCIPLKYVCDGNPQCPDFSDEWKCFNIEDMNVVLTNNTNESSVDDEDAEVHKILSIKKPNGKYLMVCANQWHQNFSNHICSKLGFGDVVRWSKIYLTENEQNSTFFRLRDSVDNNVLANLEEVDSCDDGVVAVQCEDFECGKFLELDSLKARTSNATNFPSLALAVSDNVRCTATIVAPKWALASYSCVMGKSDKITENEDVPWTLHVGGTIINENDQVPIVRIFKYPQAKFKHFFYSGDAVLLELERPLKFSERISSACLSDNTLNKPQVCMVAGFGFNSLRDLRNQNSTKLSGSSNYIYVNQCNSSNQFAGSVSDDAICSEPYGSYVNDTCYNDEGSPLLCLTDAPPTMWTLQGILSYHGNSCEPESAVYTSLPKKLLNWIVNTIGNEAIVKKS